MKGGKQATTRIQSGLFSHPSSGARRRASHAGPSNIFVFFVNLVSFVVIDAWCS